VMQPTLAESRVNFSSTEWDITLLLTLSPTFTQRSQAMTASEMHVGLDEHASFAHRFAHYSKNAA